MNKKIQEGSCVPRVIFITGHIFGRCALEGLLESNEYRNGKIDLLKVFCLHPQNALNVVGYEDVGYLGREYGLNYGYINHVKEITSNLSDLGIVDYIFAIGISQLLPKKLLEYPKISTGGKYAYSRKYGAIGMHPTLLPNGRGRAPIPWTILKSKSKSGVSCFFLTERADAGPIIIQDQFMLSNHENSNSLFEKCGESHKRIMREIAHDISKFNLIAINQDEELATEWLKRVSSDSWINFNLPFVSIDRLVKAQTDPYPNAFFVYKNVVVSVKEIEFESSEIIEPGQILYYTDENIKISCQNGIVNITKFVLKGNLKNRQLKSSSKIYTEAENNE